jgi:dipeptidyl aminopeptidase/acylaminoacyl peptidase
MDATWADPEAPRVLFSIGGGQLEIRALNLEDEGRKAQGQPQLLLRAAQSPSYSPDGRWIAFSRVFGGGVDLWLMDKDSRQMRRLTELHAAALRESNWSPDGRQIAFHARVKDKAEIFVLDVDPDAVMAAPSEATPPHPARRVVDAPFNLVSPQWSRDGKSLYVLRGDLGRQMRVPAAGGELEDLFEADAARIHPTEERIYYNKAGGDPPGMFARWLAGNVRSDLEERVLADAVSPSGWTVTSRGIFYFAARPGQPYALRFFDFSRRASFALGVTSRLGFSTLNVSPDGLGIVYDTFLETDGSMTMLQLRRRPG